MLTDAQLKKLLASPQVAIRDLDRLESRLGLSNFIKRAWSQIEPSTVYKHNWHIDAISAHLEAVNRDEIRRLILNVPPGSMKSISTSVMFPAWEWGPMNMPGMRYIGTSHSERYAIRDNSKTLSLVTSEWYQQRWGDHVQMSKFGERKISNTATGSREAIPFTSLTSGRADRLIIDDPHSTESAESDDKRETAQRIFLESVPTRLNDPEKSAIIIIMQRLHEDDVTGIALAKELGYEHVMIPMEYDPTRHFVTRWFEDPRREEGELMFPDRFPQYVVDEYKTTLGPYAAAGQLQQSPIPRGGAIFDYAWWQLWGNPDDPKDERYKRFPTCDFVVASIDTAYTEKTENDWSALTIWGTFKDAIPAIAGSTISRRQQQAGGRPKLMLMHAWQKRLPIRGLEPLPREPWENDYQYRQRCMNDWGLSEWVLDTCRRFKVDLLLIENKASGISVAQELRSLNLGEDFGVRLIDPKQQDKVARAYSVQHLFADAMVYAPMRDWAELVKDQMAKFPKGSHDDLVDSATQALRFLRDMGMAPHGFEIDIDLGQQMAYKSVRTEPLYPV